MAMMGSSPTFAGATRVHGMPPSEAAKVAAEQHAKAPATSRKRPAELLSDFMMCALCCEPAYFEHDESAGELVCTCCGAVVKAHEKRHQPFKLPEGHDCPPPSATSSSMLSNVPNTAAMASPILDAAEPLRPMVSPIPDAEVPRDSGETALSQRREAALPPQQS
jgi:hypothetical protein